MKRVIYFSILIGMVCLQSVNALIRVNPDHPYHFQKNISTDPDQVVFDDFYLISKSAYRLLDVTPTERMSFIENAANEGFNSVRIWMLWPDWDSCNVFYVWPWATPAQFGTDWYKNFSAAYWTNLNDTLSDLDSYGMEAELCTPDWGSLARMPWSGTKCEGSKFLYKYGEYDHLAYYLLNQTFVPFSDF